MDDLTLSDFEVGPDVQPIEFMGKRAYVRPLPFSAQRVIHERFGGDEEREAGPDDMIFMISSVLCDREGKLLFDSEEAAERLLGRLPGDAVLDLMGKIQAELGLGDELEKKSETPPPGSLVSV